jgi:hypothetical protein
MDVGTNFRVRMDDARSWSRSMRENPELPPVFSSMIVVHHTVTHSLMNQYTYNPCTATGTLFMCIHFCLEYTWPFGFPSAIPQHHV